MDIITQTVYAWYANKIGLLYVYDCRIYAIHKLFDIIFSSIVS